MHHLVMGQRQDEILVMMIQHGEGEIVLMVLAMNRVALEVVQCVVHPAHVPFKGESEAAVMTPGYSVCTRWLNFRRKSTASRFSRPPNWFGIHSPSFRE